MPDLIRKQEKGLFGNSVFSTLLFIWIFLCCPVSEGFKSDYEYPRRHFTPKFTSYSGNISFYVGATANLSCVIENLGARNVIWRKLPNTHPLTIGEVIYKNQDERLSISHDSSRNNWDLIITDLKLEDSGVYECQVASSNKNIRQHLYLRVKDRPVERTEPPPSRVITIAGPKVTHIGDEVYINCSATYTGVASIDWFFDGYKRESSIEEGIIIKERYSGLTKTVHSTLNIKNARMKDAGVYTCRSADEYVQNFRLTVLSEVKTNNKKRVISDFAGTESSTSSQHGNTSSRVTNSYPITAIVFITWIILHSHR